MENSEEKLRSTERSITDIAMEEAFKAYYKQWKEETASLSSNHAMAKNKNYMAIVRMGWGVVPHIINQLRVYPDHLFDALSMITGICPVKPEHEGIVKEMAKDWIEWWDSMP
jgi:hypothetical protein